MTQHFMHILTRCPLCGRKATISVPSDDWIRFKFKGVHAQDAFPYLDADRREQLITGTCPECWSEMFKYEEEDNPDVEETVH